MQLDKVVSPPKKSARSRTAGGKEVTPSQLAWDIFNSSPVATLVVGPRNGDIVDANEVALDLLQSSRELLREAGLLALVGRETRRDLRECLDQAAIETASQVTLPFQRADGTRFWARLSIRRMGTSPNHAVATIVDIEQLVIETTTDPLTGLATRDALAPAIRRAIADPESSTAVMFIDLDSFKELNDSLGHLAGDDMIKRVASCLQASVRANDLVARYGGDEFVIVMPGVTSSRRIHAVAEHIRADLAHASRAEGFQVGASIGVAVVDHRECDPAEIMVAADSAMYEAKNAGGGKVVIRRFKGPGEHKDPRQAAAGTDGADTAPDNAHDVARA